ncbi:MAG: endonuclease III [Clostridiales bacterium]|nr:endonuclease III [Clostridiales bacterium]
MILGSNYSKKKALANQIYTALSTEFPDSACSLDYDCPQNLAIRGILSAQCTDKRVNITAAALFARYPDMRSIAEEDPEVIAAVIKPCGLTASKTRSVMTFAKKMTEEWVGTVPNDVDQLMEVPGIGRKIANLIVGEIYGTPAVVVDTHCKRVMKRIGITDSDDPAGVEKDIMKAFPEEQWISIGHLSVDLGRKYCTARSPKCDECPLASFCRRRI